MFNIGVRAHDFGKMPVTALAEKIQSFEFSSIQLALKKALTDFEDDAGRLSPGLANYIRDRFNTRGINIAVLGCYINPVHPDPDLRDLQLNRFEEHLKYCRDFGCSVVGTETGSSEDIYNEETFQEFISSLKRLVTTAEKTGVIVGIEGVADKHTIFSHERMMRVLEIIQSPCLGVIYDPVNFLPNNRLSEANYLMEEAFELFANRMLVIHAKDYTVTEGKKDGTLPAGRGFLDYELLFDLIRHYKPWIHVLLENNSADTLDGAVNFIKSIKR